MPAPNCYKDEETFIFKPLTFKYSIVVSVSLSVSVYFTTLPHLGFLLFAMPSSEPLSLFPHAYIKNLDYASLSVKNIHCPFP